MPGRRSGAGPRSVVNLRRRLAGKLRVYLRPHVLVVDEVGYLPLARDEADPSSR